jgi:small subunit ribosomal protein S2
MVARAAIDGISRAQGDIGVDPGAAEEPVVEEAVAEQVVAAVPVEPVAKSDSVVETITVPELEAPTFEFLAGPRGAPDDLKKISGLGPILEQKLNDMGVFHYWQIATMGDEDAARIDEGLTLHGRIGRDDWIGQARRLAEGEAA